MKSIIERSSLLKCITPNRLALLSVLTCIFSIAFILAVEDKKEWAFTLAAGIAVSGILFNNSVKMHAEMINRTFDFILNVSDRERRAFYTSRNFLKKTNGLNNASARVIFNSNEKDHISTVNDIRTATNWIETIALTIHFNETDDDLLYKYYGGPFIDYFDLISKALPYLRGEGAHLVGSSSLYLCEFEKMAKRWEKKRAKDLGN